MFSRSLFAGSAFSRSAFSRTRKRRPRKRRPCKQRPRKHRPVTNTKTAFARERNEFKSLSSSFLFLFEVCVFEVCVFETPPTGERGKSGVLLDQFDILISLCCGSLQIMMTSLQPFGTVCFSLHDFSGFCY